MVANTRLLEEYEAKLGTRQDTRDLRLRMQQLRQSSLALVHQAQTALQGTPDVPAPRHHAHGDGDGDADAAVLACGSG